jgi:hypothetical protein
MELIPRCIEQMRSRRIGLFFVLATLGHGIALHAQDAADASNNTASASPSGTVPTGSADTVPATAPRGGTANNSNGRAGTPAQRAANRSYNRVTTARQNVVSTSARTARTGGTSVASARTPQVDSLHPYTDQARLAQAGRDNSEIPSSSSQQPVPESQPVVVRPMTHSYYPSIRTGQYPNANTAQITRGRVGLPHICVPSRGAAMAGAVRGR